jgi:leucyl aminopeptidase (aminopeptidase T)
MFYIDYGGIGEPVNSVTDLSVLQVVRSANLIITKLLKVRPSEKVLLVADTRTEMSMVTALAAESSAVGAEYLITVMSSREKFGVESHTALPESIRKILESFQVVIGLNATSGAPSYDSKVAELLHTKKIRYMSMVLRSIDNWIGGAATADYEEVYSSALKLAKVFEGKDIKVTTPAGTNLTARIDGRKAIVEAGIATEAGQSAAFSDGEVSLSTIEGTANGTVVVDGPTAYLGLPREPIRIEIEKGRVVKVSGGREATILRDWISRIQDFDNFAEIGIGVNPESRKNGDFQEEKKGLGTAHFAFGDNIYYYGKVHCPIHFDVVMYEPTAIVDGNVIAKERRLHLKA